MQVDFALMFMLPSLVADLRGLLRNANSFVEIFHIDPSLTNYVRTDQDDQYITQQYHVLPGSVQIRVVVIITTAEADTERDRLNELSWDTVKSRYSVRASGAEARGEIDRLIDRCYIAPIDAAFQASDYDGPYNFFYQRLSRLGVRISDNFDFGSPVAWDALFGINNGQPIERAPRNLGESINRLQANQRQHGNMVTRRQREAAITRRQETEQQQQQARQAAWIIDWNLVGFWDCPDGNGGTTRWPHDQMLPKHLWETLCWLITNVLPLYEQYNTRINRDGSPALMAKKWLAIQPAFRSLLQEAIRRQMTFPTEIYRYLQDYVLGRNTTAIQVSMPWSDPAASYQTEELRDFMREPIEVPIPIDPYQEFGREFRDIDLD